MITSVNYSLIPSEELFTFGTRVVALFDGKTEEGTPLNLFVKASKQKLQEFGNSFKHKDRNPFTEVLAMADAGRDEDFYAFRYYIEACCHCSLAGWSAAGLKIKLVIRKHGWSAATFGYKAETAALVNISTELRDKYLSELTFISATDWLTRMDTSQKNFETVMASNVVEISNDTPTVTETRPPFTNAMRSLLGFINMQNDVASTPELEGYITKINDLIVLTMSTVKANETRQANEKNKEATATKKE
jgi:hypothetical protein